MLFFGFFCISGVVFLSLGSSLGNRFYKINEKTPPSPRPPTSSYERIIKRLKRSHKWVSQGTHLIQAILYMIAIVRNYSKTIIKLRISSQLRGKECLGAFRGHESQIFNCQIYKWYTTDSHAHAQGCWPEVMWGEDQGAKPAGQVSEWLRMEP